MSKIIKKKFKIIGMHCTSCAINIDFDLEDMAGVKTAKTSYVKQETEVEFDEDRIDLKHLVNQIKKTGYRAEI